MELVLSISEKVQFMMDNGNKEYQMDKGLLNGLQVKLIKENFTMDEFMAKESKHGQTERFTKEILRKTKSLDMVGWNSD